MFADVEPVDVLVTRSGESAYPVVDGVPVLMRPERLTPDGQGPACDLSRPPFDEAYAEQAHYTEQPAAGAPQQVVDEAIAHLLALGDLSEAERSSFPDPWWRWVGNTSEITALESAMRHLAPLAGTLVVQLGGNGLHGLTLLAAGAARLIAVSPVLAELQLCRAVAEGAGLADRVGLVLGLGEELPLATDAIDVVFSPASLHHMHTEMAMPEVSRVLAIGGRFASVDPYRSPLYGPGVAIFGKTDPGVRCRPLDAERLQPVSAFDRGDLLWRGTSARYLMMALSRLGRLPSAERCYRLARREDRLATRVRVLRRFASVVVVLGTKGREEDLPPRDENEVDALETTTDRPRRAVSLRFGGAG